MYSILNVKDEKVLKIECDKRDSFQDLIKVAEQDEEAFLKENYSKDSFDGILETLENSKNNDIFSHLFTDYQQFQIRNSLIEMNSEENNSNSKFKINSDYNLNNHCEGKSDLSYFNLKDNKFIKSYSVLNKEDMFKQPKNYYIQKVNINHRNKPLNKKAVRAMEKWYVKHIDNPYPNCKQKEIMAFSGSISIAQVNSWFANRRNRSDNTKPKKNRKFLEAHLMQFAEKLESESFGVLKANSISKRLTAILNEYQN